MSFYYLPSGMVINLANITTVEHVTWRQSQADGSVPTFSGTEVHFVGGTRVRLLGRDAEAISLALSLVGNAA